MLLLLNNQPIDLAPPLQEWQQAEFACAPPPGSSLELRVGELLLEPFLRPGDSMWRWRWNPQNTVGVFRLILSTQGTGEAGSTTYELRVTPRKLSQEHYELLLEQLQQDAAGLAAALLGGAEGLALLRQPPSPVSALEEWAAFLAGRIEPLERAVLLVAEHPHTILRPERQNVPLAEAAELDGAGMADLARGPLDVAPPEVAPALQAALGVSGMLPATLPQQGSVDSHDSYENRLVGDLLDGLLRRARRVGALARREQQRLARNEPLLGPSPQAGRVAALAASCAEYERRLRRLRALPFLANLGPMRSRREPTQLLRRDPAYRQLYALWRDQRQAPAFSLHSPLFHLTLHDLPALYESWCAVRVARVLLDLPGWAAVGAGDERPGTALLLPSANGLEFRLPEDAPLLTLAKDDKTLTLRYQPRFRPRRRGGAPAEGSFGSLDRHTRVPDLSLELRAAGKPPRLYLFDAKYRLDASGGVPEDALSDAYAYRGSIGSSDDSAAVAAALLLYPGAGMPELYSSGVGAMPLLPGAEGHLEAWLRQVEGIADAER